MKKKEILLSIFEQLKDLQDDIDDVMEAINHELENDNTKIEEIINISGSNTFVQVLIKRLIENMEMSIDELSRNLIRYEE